MRLGIVTVSTYVALLVLLLYFVGNECKKKKSSFTFEALMAGMNAKEKEMFKEELNKEVKKFRASQQKHHKQKGLVRKPPKKRKLKDKLPKFLPGICDPICAHQCVHGCDFRCCIPDYQQNHKIPRPPPMVVLPGSCSPTCSPTCRPLCTTKCCEGGPGGMFQSSKDLITLDTQSCPEGCNRACMPRCVISCCVSHMPDIIRDMTPKVPQLEEQKATETAATGQTNSEQEAPHTPDASIAHPVENHVEHGPEQQSVRPETVVVQMRHNVETQVRPAFPPGMATLQRMAAQAAQIRNAQMTQASMLGPQSSLLMNHLPKAYFYNNRCPPLCPSYCAPLCHQGCCASAKRDYTKIPMLFKSHEMMGPGGGFSPFNSPLQFKYAAMATHPKALLPLSRQNCPVQCFASCKPNCEVRCCTLQPMKQFAFGPDQTLHARDVQSGAFMRPMSLAQVMGHPSLQSTSGLPQMMPQENAKLVQPLMGMVAPARKRVETMDPNAGNYESNVETIHALSKDMISKPEPAQQRNASPRDHVAKHEHVVGKKPRHLIVRDVIPSNATVPNDNQKQVEEKRSPTVAVKAPTSLVIKKSIVPTRNPDTPKIIAKEPQRAVRKSETVVVPEAPAPVKPVVPVKIPDNISAIVPHPNAPAKISNISVDVKGNDVKTSTLPEKSDTIASPNQDQSKPAAKATSVNQSSTVSGKSKKSIIPEKKNSVETKSLDVKRADILPSPNTDKNNNGDKKSTSSSSSVCPHQCPDTCAPDCDKPCCNRQIVYEAFHKSQKRSKVKFQLEMLK